MNEFNYISRVTLGESQSDSIVEVLRVGVIQDRGLEISSEMLKDFVNNFQNGVVGQYDEDGAPELPVNIQHNTGAEAVGWIKDLFIDGSRLFARVEWTELGREKISKKLFKFVSAEFFGMYPHHETGKGIKNVFTGLALTNTPALKAQTPLSLSEDVSNLLSKMNMFAKFLSALKAREFVSKEDKELLKSLLEELPEEEQAEQSEGVAEVEAKPEAPEADVEGGPEELPEEGGESASAEGGEDLSEKLEAHPAFKQLQEKNVEMEQKLSFITLQTEVSKEYVLSEERNIGIKDESVEKVASFMSKLSEDMRVEFKEVINEFKFVDLSVKGGVSRHFSSADKEEQITELAESLLKSGKAKDMREAQKMAADQLK